VTKVAVYKKECKAACHAQRSKCDAYQYGHNGVEDTCYVFSNSWATKGAQRIKADTTTNAPNCWRRLNYVYSEEQGLCIVRSDASTPVKLPQTPVDKAGCKAVCDAD